MEKSDVIKFLIDNGIWVDDSGKIAKADQEKAAELIEVFNIQNPHKAVKTDTEQSKLLYQALKIVESLDEDAMILLASNLCQRIEPLNCNDPKLAELAEHYKYEESEEEREERIEEE